MELCRFFREHDVFLTEEERASDTLTRLDARYHAIIEHSHVAIDGARILDIACHNGRWSIAALCSGAAHVLGVEPRGNLIDDAHSYARRYGIEEERYRFIVGDIHGEIAHFEPGQFDTILCLGFFYHTAHHFRLLEEFERLAPRHLILDTAINNGKDYRIVMTREDTSNRLMAAGDKPWAWAGRLSKPLLQDALTYAGFTLSYFDWARFIRRLDQRCPRIGDYAIGERVTIHAQPA